MPTWHGSPAMWRMSVIAKASKTYFHGVRLHTIAHRRRATIPLPTQMWLREGSCHDLASVREQQIALPHSVLIGDKAFRDPLLEAMLNQHQTTLYTPRKKPKGGELSADEKYYNRLVSRLRQPIESLFNWLIDKDGYSKSRTGALNRRLDAALLRKTNFRFLIVSSQPLIHIKRLCRTLASSTR